MDPINFLSCGKRIELFNRKTKIMYLPVDASFQYIYLFKKSKYEIKNKYKIQIKNIKLIKKGYDYKFNFYNFFFWNPKQSECFSLIGFIDHEENVTFIIKCQNEKEVDSWLDSLYYLSEYLYKLNKKKISILK